MCSKVTKTTVCVCLFFYAWVCLPVSEDIKRQIEHCNLRGNVCLLADSGPLCKDVVVRVCAFLCVCACILCQSSLSGAWSLNSAAWAAFVICMHAFPVHMCTLEGEGGLTAVSTPLTPKKHMCVYASMMHL